MGPGAAELRAELARLMLEAMQDAADACAEICVQRVGEARKQAIREHELRSRELRKLHGLAPGTELFLLSEGPHEAPPGPDEAGVTARAGAGEELEALYSMELGAGEPRAAAEEEALYSMELGAGEPRAAAEEEVPASEPPPAAAADAGEEQVAAEPPPVPATAPSDVPPSAAEDDRPEEASQAPPGVPSSEDRRPAEAEEAPAEAPSSVPSSAAEDDRPAETAQAPSGVHPSSAEDDRPAEAAQAPAEAAQAPAEAAQAPAEAPSGIHPPSAEDDRPAKAAQAPAEAGPELAAAPAAQEPGEQSSRGGERAGPAPEAEAPAEEVEEEGATVWKVVGGMGAGGIVARTARDLSSSFAGRLSNGAHVRQLQLHGTRLRYSLLSGTGPKTGWVTVSMSGKALLVEVGSEKELDGEIQAPPVAPSAQPPPPPPRQAPPPRAPPPQVSAGGVRQIFVFDWDDTLLPLTWIEDQPSPRSFRARSNTRCMEAWEQLTRYESIAEKLLCLALSLGQVAIVTLSGRDWVNDSARDYLPRCCQRLSRVPIYYAREFSTGQLSIVDDWQSAKKRLAMKQAIDSLGPPQGEKVDLISIGDSDWEKRAAQDLAQAIPGRIRWLKTVKLRERPTLVHLSTQLTALCGRLEVLAAEAGNRHVRAAELA